MQRICGLLAGAAFALAAAAVAAKQPTIEEAVVVAEFLARGDVQWKSSRYQEALNFYVEAGKISPDDPRVLYSIGSAHRELGNYRDALRSFGRILEVAPDDPRNSRVHGQIGYIHRRAGNLPTAINAYEAALKIEPNNWRTLWYLADLHYQTKEYDLTRQYVLKFKQITAEPDPLQVSDQERQEMRKWGGRLDDLLRRIEQGNVPR